MISVSQNIEAIRLQRNLTQEYVADKLSVTEQTVSDWESGESEPDIDTLVKISELLNTAITTLIYGLPNPALQKKEKRNLLFAVGILIILGVSFYFLSPIATKMRATDFISGPWMLIQLCLLPIIWLVFGWAIMQTLGIMGVAKQSESRFSKAIHVASWIVVLLYAALMLPFLIETIKCMIQALQYQQNPALFPDGFHYAYNIPLFLQKIEMTIMNTVFKHSMIFIVPSMIFWLSKPMKKKP